MTSRPEEIAAAERIVLPGVGAFADCRRGLAAVPGLEQALREAVIGRGRPFLGICVGMQLMASYGREFETVAGLGWIPGEVVAIAPSRPVAEDPAYGLERAASDQPAERGASGARRARTGHPRLFRPQLSFPADRSRPLCSPSPITADRLPRSIGRDNLIGTQFHPEKSQMAGLRLIANFLRWRP